MIGVKLAFFKSKQGYTVYLNVYNNGIRTRTSTGLIVSKNYAAPIRDRSGKVIKGKYPKIEPSDREAVQMAEIMATKKRAELIADDADLPTSKKRNSCFIDFFETICEEKKNQSYNGALTNLKQFHHGRLPFKSVNYAFLKTLQRTLAAVVSNGTVNTYMQRYKIAWNEARRMGYTKANPFAELRNLKVTEQKTKYLEFAELEALMNCETRTPAIVQKAFFFACFTGLRWGDVNGLRWDQIQSGYLEKTMDKGKSKILRVPLCETAKEILSTLDKSKKDVFHGLLSHSRVNQVLKSWADDAGIEKRLSFHSARHTFGTLAGQLGIDIYIVMALLGHSSIKQTMRYAAIMDQKKTEVVRQLPALKMKILRRV